MQNNIWQLIASTPWWMYVGTAYLLFIAYHSTKPKVVATNQLIILPFVFFALTILGMLAFVQITKLSIPQGIALFSLGAGLGWLHFSFRKIYALDGGKKLRLPGSWAFIILISSAIIANFYFGYQPNINLTKSYLVEHSQAIMITYTFAAGLMIGRMSYARRVAKHGPFLSAQ